MNSLQLWEWKREPVSPLNNEEASDDVATPHGRTQKLIEVETELVQCESKAEVASKLLDDLEQLEDLDKFIKEDFDQWIKDEPFSNWLEEKMLPTFDDVDQACSADDFIILPFKDQNHPEQALVPDTQSLLQEFETVFDAVEMNHGTLTPPQSPPYQNKPLLTNLELISVEPTYDFSNKPIDYLQSHPEELDFSPSKIDYPPVLTPQTDVAHELAVVDELIRTRAEDMVQYPSSPCSNSSGSSNFGDCSSSEDPEWIPETVEVAPEPERSAGTRKRSKPYTRAPPEEKKSRKKEQNKNAATRYRIKKKAEVEEVLEEERLLMKENDGLESQLTDLQREIKYLKGLMRDLFKAKGLIN